MSLSISTIAWKPEENLKAFSIIREVGLKFIEITPNHISKEIPNDNMILEYLKHLNDYNLTPIAMQALLHGKPDLLIFKNSKIRAQTLRYLEQIIKIGGKLGVKSLVFGAPLNKLTGKIDQSQINKISEDFFGSLGEFAKKFGIVFCVEPTPKQYGANYICTTNEAIGLIKRINNEGLKTNIDLGAILMNNEDIEYVIKKAVPFAGHLHISAPNLQRINLDEEYHKKVAFIIKESGYKGNISLEMACKNNGNTSDLMKILIMFKKIYEPIFDRA